jgi:hypothetical protein
MEKIDQIFLNGNILTMHQPRRVSAVAVTAGKTVAVGEATELRSLANSNTEIIDLEGRTLVPGFEDAHAHLEGRPTTHDVAGSAPLYEH